MNEIIVKETKGMPEMDEGDRCVSFVNGLFMTFTKESDGYHILPILARKM